MIPDSLFDLLDLDHDSRVSRSELHTAAHRLGWSWHAAPLLALLDLLTILSPIPREQFKVIMQQMQDDPLRHTAMNLETAASSAANDPAAQSNPAVLQNVQARYEELKVAVQNYHAYLNSVGV